MGVAQNEAFALFPSSTERVGWDGKTKVFDKTTGTTRMQLSEGVWPTHFGRENGPGFCRRLFLVNHAPRLRQTEAVDPNHCRSAQHQPRRSTSRHSTIFRTTRPCGRQLGEQSRRLQGF